MKLIGLAGKARSGKDTVAAMLAEKAGFRRYAFAQPLKRVVEVMFGLTREHTDGAWKEDVLPWLGRSPRYLMQTLGTEWGREHVADDVWIRLAQKQWDDLKAETAETFHRIGGLVISDCRFDNEAAWVRSQGGEVWHIQRRDAQQVEAHKSESGVSRAAGDRLILNEGTLADLEWEVSRALAFAAYGMEESV